MLPPLQSEFGHTGRGNISARRAWRMDFYAVLDQIVALLQQRGRDSYQALKRQFDLDDA